MTRKPQQKVAFYAPLKPPDHPIPSGDREIARSIISALEFAGYEVELVSRYIAYQKRPGAELFETRRSGALLEQAKLLKDLRSRPQQQRPDVWLTYHNYCKSPDWLGPPIAAEFGIPYVTIEAGRTGQNTDADWQAGREVVQAGIRQAAANFCFNQSDRTYLETVLADKSSIKPIAPFIDVEELTRHAQCPAELQPKALFTNSDPILLAVGMMRPNAKLQSYQMLAQSLRVMKSQNYNLIIVGDGPERGKVEAEFEFMDQSKLQFTGALEKPYVLGLMQNADVLSWPGYREAIGLTFLEAGALGLPIAAMNSLGVPQVVKHQTGGLLTTEGEIAAYANTLERLASDSDLRKTMGQAGQTYVMDHHSINAAAWTFKSALKHLLNGENSS